MFLNSVQEVLYIVQGHAQVLHRQRGPRAHYLNINVYIYAYICTHMIVCVNTVMFKACNNDPWSTMTSGKSPKISLPGMSPQHQLCIAWAQQIKCPRDPQNMRTVSGGNKKVNSEQWSKQETVHITAAPFHQKMFHWCFSQTMVHTQRWEKW